MEITAVFLIFLGVLMLVPLLIVWNGYVLSVLWCWFVVPIFHLPPLPLAAAIGIALIVSYMTHQIDHTENKNAKVTFGISFLRPAVALLAGWIVKQWM